jgi:transposase-like protein
VQNCAVYVALAINAEGHKELLGLWVGQAEGAKFWVSILTELKNRGVEDVLIAAVDGLKGFPDAIAAVYPRTQVQLCVVHMVRNSLRYVSWKHQKAVTRDLRKIHTAPTIEAAEAALEAFSTEWDEVTPHQPPVENALGQPDPALRLPTADPPRDLHHQRDRVDPGAAQEGYKEERSLSYRDVRA